MYEIVKNVIKSGKYNLTDISNKIDTLWVQGSLSTDECNELLEMARSGAKAEYSVNVLAKLEEFDKRLTALENDGTVTEGYSEYTAGKYYYNGDKCFFDGKSYICTAPEGVVCVWSPADYPAYWEEVV